MTQPSSREATASGSCYVAACSAVVACGYEGRKLLRRAAKEAMAYEERKPGCGLTPGTIAVMGLALLWMVFAPQIYRAWRGPGKKQQPPTREEIGRQHAEGLRAGAVQLRKMAEARRESEPEFDLEREANILDRAAAEILEEAPSVEVGIDVEGGAAASVEEARRKLAERLRARAAALGDKGAAAEAARYERAAAALVGTAAASAGATPELAGEATGSAARSVAEGLAPGVGAAGRVAERATAHAGGASAEPGGKSATGGPAPETGGGAATTDEPEPPEPDERKLVVETNDLLVEVTNRGASVRRAALLAREDGRYKYTFEPGGEEPLDMLLPLGGETGAANSFIVRPREDGGFPVDLSTRVWRLVDDSGGFEAGMRTVRFETRAGRLGFTKTYTFHETGLVFDVALVVRNGGAAPTGKLGLDFVGPNGIAPDAARGRYFRIEALFAGRDGEATGLRLTRPVNAAKAKDMDIEARSFGPKIEEWAALKNRYFAALMQVEDPDGVDLMFAEAAEPEAYKEHEIFGQPNARVAMALDLAGIAPGGERLVRFRSYLGPRHKRFLRDAAPGRGWEALVDFGRYLGWLCELLLKLLVGAHYLTGWLPVFGGYGLAILFLTITVKGALHPLQRKMMVSMHKMQLLSPQIKAIKKKHEKDKSMEGKRRMQTEQQELFRKHGVNPLGGCLPMAVQLPMFIALFGMLRGAFELRHERFLWIPDLTSPDELIGFGGFKLPLLGWTALNLLPVLYIGLILLQQRLQPKPDDPDAQRTQNTMKFMSVFFFFIFYNMPSGLVLYFVFSNAIGILEQWYIRTHLLPASGLGQVKATTSAGPVAAEIIAPPTSWDRQAERQAKQAEKRKRRKEKRRGPGM